jgi:hypothetical protein
MSESAYDITYLLEAELAKFSAPPVRSECVSAVPAAPAPDVATTQAAMARELLSIDAAHEELIRQYMQIIRHTP